MDRNEVNKIADEGIELLLAHAGDVGDKYDYYNADNEIRDYGIATPKGLRSVRPGVGWASRAVNTLSDRVVFDGFGNDRLAINELLMVNNGINILNKAKHDAIIAGMSTIAVSGSELIPFTALESTGEIDQRTGLFKWGLAVTDYEEAIEGFKPIEYVLFTPYWNALFSSGQLVEIVDNPTGRTLLTPITRRASAEQPLGKSKITNTVRRIINEVGRVKRRYEIAGEFYSIPQRWLTGLSEDFDLRDLHSLDSQLGKLWGFTTDSDGNKAELGQLQQMSINQFNDNKKDLARDFCAETSLTLRNLGYETSNPTSAESLAALSDDMLLEAQQLQRDLGQQFKNVIITLRMNMDKTDNVSTALLELEPSWQPIFQTDIGATGDAVHKLSQVMPELFNTTAGYRMLGLSMRESENLLNKRLQDSQDSLGGINNEL